MAKDLTGRELKNEVIMVIMSPSGKRLRLYELKETHGVRREILESLQCATITTFMQAERERER